MTEGARIVPNYSDITNNLMGQAVADVFRKGETMQFPILLLPYVWKALQKSESSLSSPWKSGEEKFLDYFISTYRTDFRENMQKLLLNTEVRNMYNFAQYLLARNGEIFLRRYISRVVDMIYGGRSSGTRIADDLRAMEQVFRSGFKEYQPEIKELMKLITSSGARAYSHIYFRVLSMALNSALIQDSIKERREFIRRLPSKEIDHIRSHPLGWWIIFRYDPFREGAKKGGEVIDVLQDALGSDLEGYVRSYW